MYDNKLEENVNSLDFEFLKFIECPLALDHKVGSLPFWVREVVLVPHLMSERMSKVTNI